MYNILRRIADDLKADGLKYSTDESKDGSLSWIRLGWNGKDGAPDFAVLVTAESEKIVKIRVISFYKFKEDKLGEAYILVNKLNGDYRFCKFWIDDDNELSCQDDLPTAVIDAGLAGKYCAEVVRRFASILNDVYPEIMKVVWGR